MPVLARSRAAKYLDLDQLASEEAFWTRPTRFSTHIVMKQARPRIYKTSFVLNSTEHEI